MRTQKGNTYVGFAAIIVIVLAVSGWVMNLVGFIRCDFEAPYRCEVVRGVGIFIPPVGAVAGWVSIDP